MGPRSGQTKQKVEGISVFVRVRATDAQDQERESSKVVQVNENETSICVRDNERPNKSIECAFDRIFGPESTQEDVFLGLVPALDTVINGFNASVLAYGQTGSGKTHTLIGPGGGTRLPTDQTEWGIIPRAVQFLFDRLALASDGDETFSYSVTCSFLQIYNENLVDLLLQDGGIEGGTPSLQIREEAGGAGRGEGAYTEGRHRRGYDSGGGSGEDATTVVDGESGIFGVGGGRNQNRSSAKLRGRKATDNRRVFVNGLSSFRVGGAQDVLRYVNLGAANRRVRATRHNEASSRSHAVMQLTVEVKSGGHSNEEGRDDCADGDGHVTYRQAKLNLVDLAGSEKMGSGPKISKGHFKELRSINQSLSTLGNVVSALSEKGRTHVPYRDSKLTRLLQDSLGGNTRTTIIACINPVEGQTHETINTLQFADRAKKVMVRLRANEVVDDRLLLARARAEIKRLKQRLREALEGTLLGAPTENDNMDDGNAEGVDMDGSPGSRGRASGGELNEEQGGDAEHSLIATAGKTTGERNIVVWPHEDKEQAVVTSAATTATITTAEVESTHKRQTAKLIAENERLRDDNDRLRADIQRLVLQNNKQRLKRQRRQCGAGRLNGNVSRGPPPSPIDWSTRYADAAAQARRRRSASSHQPSLDLNTHPRVSLPSPSSSSRVLMREKTSSAMINRTAEGKTSSMAPTPGLNLRKFCWRQFNDSGSRASNHGNEGEGKPIEDTLSHEEIQAFISDGAEAEETVTNATLTGSEEENQAFEERQLAMFRRELQGGIASRGFLERGGGAGRGGRGGGLPPASAGTAGKDTSFGVFDHEEQTDINYFLEQSQRLEDTMFEAQDRERRRLREERGHLARARAERLSLEAQLAGLSRGGSDETLLVDTKSNIHASPETANNTVMQLPIPSATPSSYDKEEKHQPVPKTVRKQCQPQQPQQPQQEQEPPPPCFDGAIPMPAEHRTPTSKSSTVGANRFEAATSTSTISNNHAITTTINRNSSEARIGWVEQSESNPSRGGKASPASANHTTNAATTAMMMAVLAPNEGAHGRSNEVYSIPSRENSDSDVESPPNPRARRTVHATRISSERRRQQVEQATPVTIPLSHQNSLSPSGSRQRRPATSTGGPPTGSSRARSRPRNIYQQVGRRRVGHSKPPVRRRRLAFLDPTSPSYERCGGGNGNSQHTPPWQQQQQQQQQQRKQGRSSSVGGDPGVSSPEKIRRFTSTGLGESPPAGAGHHEGRPAKQDGLTYGVGDLGLRLKVYSFRYDHYYECQVVGYDSRRRMHRCTYDVTGEKQWHDLSSKHFEVAGHNGVVRSTESAPPVSTSAHPAATGRDSTPPSVLLPTHPSVPLDGTVDG